MTKNKVTVDCKIKYLKNLISKKKDDDEIFFGDQNIKENVINTLKLNEWIIDENGKYEINTNISLDSYSIQTGINPQAGISHSNFKFPEEDWVKSQTAKYLKTKGYQIVYVAWGHDKGTDVIGYNPKTKRFINVEVKGGTKAEKTDFYECLGQCIASISNTDEDYAMAFPWRTQDNENYCKNYNVYGECWNTINKNIKNQLNIKAFFIKSDGTTFISDETSDICIDKYPRMYNPNKK